MKKKESSMEWIWKVSGKKKINIVFLLVLQAALGISGVIFAWLLREAIDYAVDGQKQAFFFFVAMLVLLTAGQIVFRALVRYLSEETKASMENRFKNQLFETLLTKDYESVNSVHSGEWMNRLTSDTIVVAEGLATIVPDVIGLLVQMCGALIMILTMLPAAIYIVVPGAVALVLLTYGFRKRLKELHRQMQESDGTLRMFMQERLGSLLVIKAFAKESQIAEEAETYMDDHKKARMKKNHFSNICNIGFGTIMRGVYVFGAIYCGYGIMLGNLSYGTLIAVLQLIGQIQSPFANITGYLPKFYAMLASAERLMEAEYFEKDTVEDLLDADEIRKFYQEDFAGMGLKDASFAYMPISQSVGADKNGAPVVLEHINLQIQKGEYVAVCGPSGCGKSTLLKLLMCLYPLDSGERYMDIRGGETSALTKKYQRLFAYVPQGSHLMSGSIRQVISFAQPERQQDEQGIWYALKIACAGEFVQELELGLDTVLGEHGAGLSEGQMQRLSIARAVFSDNPVLILDEATSALDEETEQRVLRNLQVMTDKTVLIITHRPAALRICSRQILMSENGIMVQSCVEE